MSKWDGNEAGFQKWLTEKIATIACKPAQSATTSVHKFDPDIARFERWKRERQWIYSWYEINAHRPGWIDTTIPADWIDLVETQPLERIDISSIHTTHVQAIRHTEQMRPVPVTDPIPKVTASLSRDQSEYRIASVSLRENMKHATKDFYANQKKMPSKIFLSSFNFAVASTQNIIQEAVECGQPVMFFVYADLFLVAVEEYGKLSDQTILCWQ